MSDPRSSSRLGKPGAADTAPSTSQATPRTRPRDRAGEEVEVLAKVRRTDLSKDAARTPASRATSTVTSSSVKLPAGAVADDSASTRKSSGGDSCDDALVITHVSMPSAEYAERDTRQRFVRDFFTALDYIRSPYQVRRTRPRPVLDPEWAAPLATLVKRLAPTPSPPYWTLQRPRSFPDKQLDHVLKDVRMPFAYSVLLLGYDATMHAPRTVFLMLMIGDDGQLREYTTRFRKNRFERNGEPSFERMTIADTRDITQFPLPIEYKRHTVAILCRHEAQRFDWHLLCLVCYVLWLLEFPAGQRPLPCHKVPGCTRCATMSSTARGARIAKFELLWAAVPAYQKRHGHPPNKELWSMTEAERKLFSRRSDGEDLTNQFVGNAKRIFAVLEGLRHFDLRWPFTVAQALETAVQLREKDRAGARIQSAVTQGKIRDAMLAVRGGNPRAIAPLQTDADIPPPQPGPVPAQDASTAPTVAPPAATTATGFRMTPLIPQIREICDRVREQATRSGHVVEDAQARNDAPGIEEKAPVASTEPSRGDAADPLWIDSDEEEEDATTIRQKLRRTLRQAIVDQYNIIAAARGRQVNTDLIDDDDRNDWSEEVQFLQAEEQAIIDTAEAEVADLVLALQAVVTESTAAEEPVTDDDTDEDIMRIKSEQASSANETMKTEAAAAVKTELKPEIKQEPNTNQLAVPKVKVEPPSPSRVLGTVRTTSTGIADDGFLSESGDAILVAAEEEVTAATAANASGPSDAPQHTSTPRDDMAQVEPVSAAGEPAAADKLGVFVDDVTGIVTVRAYPHHFLSNQHRVAFDAQGNIEFLVSADAQGRPIFDLGEMLVGTTLRPVAPGVPPTAGQFAPIPAPRDPQAPSQQ